MQDAKKFFYKSSETFSTSPHDMHHEASDELDQTTEKTSEKIGLLRLKFINVCDFEVQFFRNFIKENIQKKVRSQGGKCVLMSFI